MFTLSGQDAESQCRKQVAVCVFDLRSENHICPLIWSALCCKFLHMGSKDDEMGGIETEQLSCLLCLVPLHVGWRGSWEERSSVRAAGVVCPSWQQPQPCGTSGWEVTEAALAPRSPAWGGKGRTLKRVLKPFFISVCFLTAAVQGLRRRVFDPATLLSLDVLNRDCLQSLYTSSYGEASTKDVFIF